MLFRSLIRSLAKEKKADLKNHRTSKNADGFSMITSKINQREIHTFYNKIEKAKKNKQIRKINSSLNNLEIFRYEIELTDNNIANKFDSHFLTELTDEKIIQYLESILSLAIFEYLEILEKSISSCNRKLKRIYRECKPQDYMTVFLLFVIDLPSVVVGVAFHALVTRGGPLEALDLDGTLTAVVAALAFFN